MEIRITRAKNYPVVSRPGPAWRWDYQVHVPGEKYAWHMGVTHLSHVRSVIKRKYPDATVVETWKVLG